MKHGDDLDKLANWLVYFMFGCVITILLTALSGCMSYPGVYIHEEVGDLCKLKKYERRIGQHKRIDKVECYEGGADGMAEDR
jgi:hypothetical protein